MPPSGETTAPARAYRAVSAGGAGLRLQQGKPELTMRWPWQDRVGRFSPFKTTVFALLFAPGLWVGYLLATGGLGQARPLNDATLLIGLWVIRLLLLSLAVTPARHLFRLPQLMTVRRMIGVSVAAYIVIHFTLYSADLAFDWPKIASEVALRIYLTIGFAALVGLFILAATSTDGMVRRLGRRWRTLHRIVYGIAILGIIHFFLQEKADVGLPTLYAAMLAWLLTYRALDALFGETGTSLPVLLAMTVAVAAGTAGGEALYFYLKLGVDPGRVLAAQVSLAAGLRPSVTILLLGFAVLAASAARRHLKRGARSQAVA
jgi:sulfoxide reductase heme-binding subunit YedZ